MARQRRGSNVSNESSLPERNEQVRLLVFFEEWTTCSHELWPQELGSMYDYLAKVILLGPSGSGKSVYFSNPSTIRRAYLAPGPVYCIAS